ncbi:MAG: hypothetical protein KU28_00810 [Sulfurovum sp. PC08-66]|nr:MAG: hypothetical protein KU28_00810 [Sulfurovum sp. PC08-66]KIM12507.1 MAG: hypothetical protein KU37_00925 [Sulfuricurvum sp. PC08-66]
MTIGEVLARLDALSPFVLQEKWDNSGLQVGDKKRDVSHIVLSLDIDAELIESTPEGTLFIVHHPLIFSPLKALDFATYPANLIASMMRKNQSLIAMHTNFDQTHLNGYVLEEIMGWHLQKSEGYIAYAEFAGSFEALVTKMGELFGFEHLKTVPTAKPIKRIALCTGSGASMIASVDADCFITGDIKYHDAMQAKALGLGLIDIGHYESERYFAQVLQKELKDWSISVIISASKNPFDYSQNAHSTK